MSDSQSVRIDPVLLQPSSSQPYLFVEVFRDDADILASEDGYWLQGIKALGWRSLQSVAAGYYQGLWEANQKAARERAIKAFGRRRANSETQEQARLRLVAGRPTGGNVDAPLLVPPVEEPVVAPTIHPELLEPGVVPFRLGGKTPKCFFALVRAFVGVHLMGKSGSAEEVLHHLLVSPTFRRACGFTPRRSNGKYRASDVPRLRKLQQFDKIMAARGLWSTVKKLIVGENLVSGVVDLDNQSLTYDTTHYVAFSEIETVSVPAVSPSPIGETEMDVSTSEQERPQKARVKRRAVERAERRARRKAKDEARRVFHEEHAKKKALREGRTYRPSAVSRPSSAKKEKEKTPKRKSQSRTVKNCRCPDRANCPHDWVLSDPGAGTIVKGTCKGGKKKIWGHKAAVLSTGPGGVPLDVGAMFDAASHDSQGLLPQLAALFAAYPFLLGVFHVLLADAAMDDPHLKEAIRRLYGLTVKTPVNRRSIKTLTEGLGRGMKSLSPTGTLTCVADRELEYLGVRFATEHFLYGPPAGKDGMTACATCPHRLACCQSGSKGRVVAVKFTRLRHIDPSDPPMARRFKALMRRRTAVERAIKRLKLDFGDERLTRRGSDAFQAHLDRSLIALHLTLRLER